MKLTNFITLLLIFVLALSGFNCKSSEEPTENNDPSGLVGAWIANAATPGTKMVFKEPNSGFEIDVVPLGASVNVTLASDYNYSLTIVFPGEDPIVETGKATFNGDKLTMTPDGGPEDAIIFTYSRSGDLLTLHATDVEFSFDGENDVPAELTLVLKKVVN